MTETGAARRGSRICVVGAGAAGLSAAYYLEQRGYHVTVLEKADRIGGKCHSVSSGGRWFDLGANYVTAGYTHVLALARAVGAELYTEAKTVTAEIPEHGAPVFRSPLRAILGRTFLLRFGLDILRYVWLRYRLAPVVDPPGFAGLTRYPELCVSFGRWLDDNQLSSLRAMFEVPLTIMGYGYLDEIPAPHALKYMSLPTFWNLVFVGADLPRAWPKRFVEGFEGFWRRIADGLDVQLSVTIQRIERTDSIQVALADGRRLEFDALVLACGLGLSTVESFLTLTETERTLFGKIVVNPYVLTAHKVHGLRLPARIVGMLPVPAMGRPWAITQQFPDNDFVQFYSRVDREGRISLGHVADAIAFDVAQLGGALDPSYASVTPWQYFPHVTVSDFADGFFDRLEGLQGQRHTYYCGGVMAFELVEPIVAYSQQLVARHFPAHS